MLCAPLVDGVLVVAASKPTRGRRNKKIRKNIYVEKTKFIKWR
jgi:hypothetical protein